MSTPNEPNPHDRPASDQPAQGYGQPAAPGYGDPATQGGYGGAATQGGYGGAPASPSNGLGIAALVLGILALLGSWVPFLGLGGAVLAIIGIILGVMARGKVKRGEATNGGMAMTGIVLSVVAILVAIASTVVGVLALQEAGSGLDGFTECAELPLEEQQACFDDL